MAEFPVDVLTFNERGGDPGATASSGKYYTKDVGGITRWFYQDSAGVVSQLAAGLVPPANSVDYRHLSNKLVTGGNTLLSTTSLQSVFGASNDTVSLEAATTYAVRGLYMIENAGLAGIISIGFSGGTIGVGTPGDALISLVCTTAYNPALNTPAASSSPYVFIDSTANVWNVLDNAVSLYKRLHFTGKIRTVSGGTFTPQIRTVNAIASALVMKMSYLECIPVGGAAFESTGQGGWF